MCRTAQQVSSLYLISCNVISLPEIGGYFKVISRVYNPTFWRSSLFSGDIFSYRDGSMFSSASRDNDQTNVTNCAAQQDAPWWYNNCFHVCLTCEFTKKPKKPSGKGITWANPWHYKTFAKYVLMMIRPVKWKNT